MAKRIKRRVQKSKGTREGKRRLHPKLRMIANGNDVVNGLRAELSSLVVSTIDDKRLETPKEIRTELVKPAVLLAPGNEAAFSGRRRLRKRARLKQAQHAFVNVFIELERDRVGAKSIAEGTETIAALVTRLRKNLPREESGHHIDGQVIPKRHIVCATVRVSDLDELAARPDVAFVQPADPITFNLPKPANTGSRAPTSRMVERAKDHGGGAGVLIGIIDVGGFDFAHPDFLAADGKTRFVSVWDQGGDLRDPPKGFSFGAEITATHMNAAIAASKKPDGLPAVMLERQSQSQPGSHGTHVASIAAGNSGICPNADIAAVLIDIPPSSDKIAQRRFTFSDSSRIAHAVDYLLELGRQRNQPVSINISLGTNGGGHDGSSGVSRWIDAVLSTEGRSICVAAGNAGQEGPTNQSDVGWIMGRIHSSGRVSSRGLDVDLEWVVVGDSIADISENEMEIWHGPQDRFAVQLRPPGSDSWISVKPREFVENKRLASGTTVSIYNELYHPTNGCNYIAIYLSPNLDPQQPIGVKGGVWTVRLTGEDIRDGRFHCWIERDDPFEIDRLGNLRVFRFPSFFSERSNVDSHSINSLACGHRVVAVANCATELQRINVTSSQGPTRDDRLKPDVAAPGTNIVAANGFGVNEPLWTSMSGTSMASPYVAGVIGLMLAANRKLTAAQCLGILQRTSRPLPGATYAWRDDAGFGQIDPNGAIAEAAEFNERFEVP